MVQQSCAAPMLQRTAVCAMDRTIGMWRAAPAQRQQLHPTRDWSMQQVSQLMQITACDQIRPCDCKLRLGMIDPTLQLRMGSPIRLDSQSLSTGRESLWRRTHLLLRTWHKFLRKRQANTPSAPTLAAPALEGTESAFKLFQQQLTPRRASCTAMIWSRNLAL
jgi:hypothetical protein